MCVCVGGGGGVLSTEKGINCCPTAAEMWLLQANIAKKGGCPAIIKSIGRRQMCLYVDFTLNKAVCIQSYSEKTLKTDDNYNKIKSIQQIINRCVDK